jgi:2-(1,2-epoxy-1,2-dihydrophenyl)acetyl-CoA isomerase
LNNIGIRKEELCSMSVILLEKDNKVALLTLNRPDKLNSINPEMAEMLEKTMVEVSEDDEIKAIVIRGEGRAFCAGGDFALLKALNTPEAARKCIRQLGRVIETMTSMKKPIIAAVEGAAVGAGCNLALACDFAIASETSKFGEVFVNIGLVPDMGGGYLLTKRVGPQKAKELIMTGRMIPGPEAVEIGLALKCVKPDELMPEAIGLARKLAKGPSIALGYSKYLVNISGDIDLKTYLDIEADYQAICLNTEDHKEGLASFGEKRKPEFKGR